MGEVICTLVFSESQRRDLVLPDHIPVHQLGDSLARALGLPRSRDVYYELHLPDGDELRRIPEARSLQQAYVLNGSCLHLVMVQEDPEQTAFLVTEGGQKMRLRQSTLIGRLTAEVHIDIDLTALDTEKVVSRRHAAIRRTVSHFLIKDLGSRNGTFVNNIQLKKDESRVLHPGDRICFGSLEKGVELQFKGRIDSGYSSAGEEG
jgi:hypothetical protein